MSGHFAVLLLIPAQFRYTHVSARVPLVIWSPMQKKRRRVAQELGRASRNSRRSPSPSLAPARKYTLSIEYRSRCANLFRFFAISPESGGDRQNVLQNLERLSQKSSNFRFLMTSRELGDLRRSMSGLGADTLPIASRCVDADISQYLSTEMSRDWKLSQLDLGTKAVIEETISKQADVM